MKSTIRFFISLPGIQALMVCLVALALQVPGLGRDFSTRGEPREALVAQAMLASGDWILPAAYGGGVPSKPPFSHWLMSGCGLMVGGMSEFAARLPSVMASTVFLVAFFLFARRRVSVSSALLAVSMVAMSIEWFRTATSCRVDMVFSACFCGGLLAFYQWSEGGYRGYPFLLVILLSAATLAKGPVALAISGPIFLVWSLLDRNPIRVIAGRGLAVYLPVLAAATAWYVLAYLSRPEEFMAKVWYENVARFASQQDDEPHKKSVLFLYFSIVVGLLPGILLWVPRVTGSRRLNFRRWFALEAFDRYSWLCILMVVAFFSIPAGKRSVYLLPVYPFFSYLLAQAIMRGRANVRWHEILVGLLAAVACLFAGILAILPSVSSQSLLSIPLSARLLEDLKFLSTVISQWREGSVGYWLSICALLGVAGWAVVLARREVSPIVRFGVLTAVLYVIGNGLLFPQVAAVLSGRDFAVRLASISRLFSFGTEYYSLSFYSGRPILRFEEHRPDTGMVLLNESDVNDFRATVGSSRAVTVEEISERGIIKPSQRVVLLRLSPISPNQGLPSEESGLN